MAKRAINAEIYVTFNGYLDYSIIVVPTLTFQQWYVISLQDTKWEEVAGKQATDIQSEH